MGILFPRKLQGVFSMSKEEIQNIINHSIGTTAYHKFSAIRGFPVITDGIKAVAEASNCYWLLDVIGSYQIDKKLDKAFQVWKLEVNTEENSGVVRGYNDTKLIITQEIPFTDFPITEFKLFLMDGVILLPNEY
jgi:hypothetical protein